MNRQQFLKMRDLAAEKQLFFMEALWTRFIPSFIKAKELVDDGIIGEVKLIESDFCFNAPMDESGRVFNPELGGGALLDIGIYPIFIALELGGDIKNIKAMTSFARTGVDSMCNILAEHKNGVMSVLLSSILNPGKVESVIHGTKGMLRLNKWWHTPTSIDLIFPDQETQHISFEEPGNGYQYEAIEVMKCLDAGEIQSSVFSWEHSDRLIKTLDLIRELGGIKYPKKLEKL
jgi:predicted dehydrogenase